VPPADQSSLPHEDPQQAVAKARAAVLRGRGPGVDKAERDRCQQGRLTLGALPTSLERELVHLQTAWIRTAQTRDTDRTSLQDEIDRLREMWC
jgi:hypothetical protein